MSIFHPARMAHADASAAADRDGRLRLGQAVIAIVLLSGLSWGVVALIALGLHAAL
jgi:hypothetical protein